MKYLPLPWYFAHIGIRLELVVAGVDFLGHTARMIPGKAVVVVDSAIVASWPVADCQVLLRN